MAVGCLIDVRVGAELGEGYGSLGANNYSGSQVRMKIGLVFQ